MSRSGKSSEIRIDVKSDSKDNDTEWVTVSNEVDSFHLSPWPPCRGGGAR